MNSFRDKEWLKQKYEKEGLSCKAIGELCGVSRMTVSGWLRRLGIPTRSLSEAMKANQKKRKLKEALRILQDECAILDEELS